MAVTKMRNITADNSRYESGMKMFALHVRPLALVTAYQRFLIPALLSLLFVVSSHAEGPKAKASDVVTRLCQHIVEKRRKMIVDTNQTEIVWSDGAILEVGTNFPSGLQELISRPNRYHDIRSFVKQLDTASTFEWKEASVTPSVRREGYATIKSLDGKIAASVQSLYVEYLRERYPTATIRIRGEFEPIIFVVDRQIRASVMPMKL